MKLLTLFLFIFSSSLYAQLRPIIKDKYDDVGPNRGEIIQPYRATTVSTSSSSRNYNSRCQSYSSCSFNIKQIDQNSTEVINALNGNRNGCVPTATAMLLNGILGELDSNTVPGSHLRSFASIPRDADKVRYIANNSGLRGGGTTTFNIPFVNNLKKYLNKNFVFSKKKEYEYKVYGNIFSYPKRNNSFFVNEIRNKKTGYLLTLTSHRKKGRRWVRKGFKGHVVAMTGFNGDRLEINDPWYGMKYFVKIEQQKLKTCTFCFKGQKSVLKPASTGYTAYVGTEVDKGRKVIMRQYFKLKAY